MLIPAQAALALRLLEQSGYEGWLVGGCVRDDLMGVPAHDVDLATDAAPSQMLTVFRDYPVIETGLRHGTLTVLIDGMPLEITTYRVDVSYSDHRHPDAVQFTKSLREDLARRDFTMNAIAWHPHKGYFDPFGGAQDIENALIRAVGEADQRFFEDSLRILRGLRFSAVLGFSVEQNTFEAMRRQKKLLHAVSPERIRAEICKTIIGIDAVRVLETGIEILGELLPELLAMRGFDQRNPFHCYDLLHHTLAVINAFPPDPVLRLAALWHDVGKLESFTLDQDGIGHYYGHAEKSAVCAQTQMQRLRFDNFTRDRVCALIRLHDLPIQPAPQPVKRLLRRLTPELFFLLLDLQAADAAAQSACGKARLEGLTQARQLADEIIAAAECFTLRQLAVNGSDLLACGVPQGKAVGNALQELLSLVVDGKMENDRETLLAYIRRSFCSFP